MQIFKNKMFFKWAKSEGIKDSTLIEAVNEIDRGLVNAYLGGHLIKKRLARKGQGKQGGFRTIVIFQKRNKAIFVYGFPKNKCDSISELEEQALKK